MRSVDYFEEILKLLTPYYPPPLVKDPATEEEIQALESHIGQKLPDDLRAVYLLHNGSDEESFGLMIYDFISLEEMASTYDSWVETIKYFETFPDPNAPEFLSYPSSTIQPVYFDRGWIPFAHSGGGNHLAIDFSPDKKGTEGQVINYGRDDDVHFRFSKDFTGFLEFTLEMYQAGRFHTEIVKENQSNSEIKYPDGVIQYQRKKYGLAVSPYYWDS